MAVPIRKWYQRDASFFRYPDTRGGKRLHRPHPTKVGKYGHRMSLCGRVPLLTDYGTEWGDPPTDLMCKTCLRMGG